MNNFSFKRKEYIKPESLGAIKGENGINCPNCFTEFFDSCGELYYYNGEEFPKIINEQKGYDGNGNYWDWDEIHSCHECHTKFYIENGAF